MRIYGEVQGEPWVLRSVANKGFSSSLQDMDPGIEVEMRIHRRIKDE
jgi:hypothetical protein